MYCRPSARWLTSPRCSSRTSIVATVVGASRRPVIARWTSVTDASSRDQSTCMTVSCDAVRRGGAAAFRGMPEYYTRRRRTASQGGSQFDQRIFRVVGPTVRQKRSSAGCYCGKDAPKFTDEDLKIRPGYAGGVLPVAPPNHLSMLHDYIEPSERAGACPNQDVTCGQMVLSLDRDAVVIQVPDFGNRFWVYQIVDQRSDEDHQGAELSGRHG